ncbi:hypothetical protein BTA51_26570 [Hahella sp. CCB-MM4]|nr:hypothetical protein BTA51_26570 [Hahella sp. CCB-MM4]
MSLPEPMTSYDPNAGVSDQDMSLTSADQSQLDAQTPQSDVSTPGSGPDQSGQPAPDEGTAGEDGQQMSSGDAPEGGTYDETLQQCIPDDAQQSVSGDSEAEPAGDTVQPTEQRQPISKKPALPVELIARTGTIRAPRVPPPPASALKRRTQIQRQTGDTPEMHQAKIQVAVLRVVDAARDGQRQIVWRIGNLARDTRKSFDEIAREIMAFAGGCIARVRAAVAQAKTDLTTAVDLQLNHLSEAHTLTGEELQTSKTEAQDQVMYQLMEPGSELEQANIRLQEEFAPYLTTAKNNIRNIEQNGAAFALDPPPGTEALQETQGDPPRTSDPANGPQQTMPQAKTDLDNEVAQKRDRDELGTWYAHRITPVLNSLYNTTRGQLEESLGNQADALDSYKSEFSRAAMSLSTPLSESFRSREGQAQQCTEDQVYDARHTLAISLGEHGDTLINKFDGVISYLDEELEPKLVEGLQKAGSQAAKAFRDQGEVSERMMNNTAATLAMAYPELIVRVAEMLPEGQFLNERELAPRLKAAWESSRRLPDQQYAQMVEQSEMTIAQARESAKNQMASLGETAEKSLQQVSDTVVATKFDFETFGFQVTGRMRDGGMTAITGARDYALRMAERILSTSDEENGALARLIRNFVGSLNQSIGGAGRNYFQGVDSFKTRMNDPGEGIFMQIETECDEYLNPKAQELDEELTKPDPDVTTGLVILNVATLGATTGLTAGYLIYSDADDDEIFAVLGDLQWPSQPALKFFFESSDHANKGDLFNRFDECLSEDAAERARGLFSSSASDRFNARRASIQDSLTLFGLDADARRALSQGLDETERTAAGDDAIDALVAEINDSWVTWFQRDTQTRMDEGYLRGDMGMVLSARLEQDLANARSRGSDEIFQSVQRIEQMAREELQRGQSRYLEVDPAAIQSLTDQAIMDFAERHRPPDQQNGEDLSLTDARRIYLDRALADRYVHTGDTVQQVPVDQRVKDYAEAAINGGWQSQDTLAASQAYEMSRAEQSTFRPSETDTNRVTRAFADPELANIEREIQEHPERADQLRPRLEELRQRHEERMARVAKRLDPTLTDEDLQRAGGAVAYMAQRTARMFSGGEDYRTDRPSGERRSHAQEDAQYGYELISQGRASLTAGIRMATRGGGTNEDLLRMTYQNRSKTEVDQARADWQSRYNENLDEYLGIQHRSPEEEARIQGDPVYGWLQGGEVSGDLANEIQILARGNPESDQDRIELAILRYQQQRRRGTGGLARWTMSGTDEAQTIDSHYQGMGQMLLDEARRRRDLRMQDPNYTGDEIPLPERPEDVFTHDGRISPLIAGLIFVPGPNRGGRSTPPIFTGDRALILDRSRQVGLAGDRYKSELDRQEGLMLAGITALAIAATVILMAFGVGFVLASIIVALGSGLLTMAVKSGMRGERYGWEEAAVDAASTAIEVAAAGAGGAIAKGMGPAAQITGALSKVGAALEGTFGQFGGLIAREALVGSVSMAANTALQDDTYKDGPGAAFGRILLGGVKGGAISAVSAGISESLGNRINSRLVKGLDNIDDITRLSRLGRALGPSGRNIIKEGIAEGLGGLAGEATGILIEVSSGTYKGGLKDALKRMGQAGLKDMVSAAGRAGASAIPRQRYNDLMAAARRSSELTDSDLNALRAAAKAAGEDPPSIEDMRRQIDQDRHMLNQLPDDVRRYAESMDSNALRQLVTMMQSGQLAGSSDNRRQLLERIGQSNPEISSDDLLKSIEANSQRVRLDDTGDVDAQHQMRERMIQQLPEPVRNVLKDIPMQGLEHLPDAQLPKLAEAMARGRLTAEETDSFLRAARESNPELDAVTFLKNLNSAVQSARLAQEAHTRILQKQRSEVLRDVPDADAALFSRFSDEQIAILRSAMSEGEAPSSHRLNELFEAALKIDPTIDRASFEASIKQSVDNAHSRRQEEAVHQRQQREKMMENVPESLRGILSVLPDAALLEFRIRQMDGELSPANRQKLIDQAMAQDPSLDLKRFNKALDDAMEHGQSIQRSAEDTQQMRNELMALVPPDQRHLLNDVPILVMSDAEFRHYAQSDSGNAVTVILGGKPVVIIREGASPKVLREEGIHAMQAQDPRWAKHIGSLDEGHLQRWEDLPVDVQVALYRNKLDLEIDAHDRMIEQLGERLRLSEDPAEQKRLHMELELAQRTLLNLQKRMAEVDQLTPLVRMQIQAGLLPRPQYLDQPARMFNKADLKTAVATSGTEATRTKYEKMVESLSDSEATKLLDLDLGEADLRSVLNRHKDPDKRSKFIDQLHSISTTLKAQGDTETFGNLLKRSDLTDLAPIITRCISQTSNDQLAATLISSIANLSANHLDTARKLEAFMEAAKATPNAMPKLEKALLHPDYMIRLLRSSDDPGVAHQRILDLAELKNRLPMDDRADILKRLSERNDFEALLSPLAKTAQLLENESSVRLIADAIASRKDNVADSAETLYKILSTASDAQIRQFETSGLAANHINKVLRSSLNLDMKAARLHDLAAIATNLPRGIRKLDALNKLLELSDYGELVPRIKQMAESLGDSALTARLIDAVASQDSSRAATLDALTRLIPAADAAQLQDITKHLLNTVDAKTRIETAQKISQLAAGTPGPSAVQLIIRLSADSDFIAKVSLLHECRNSFDDGLMQTALSAILTRPGSEADLINKFVHLANNLTSFQKQFIQSSGIDADLILRVMDLGGSDLNKTLSLLNDLTDTLSRISATNRPAEINRLKASGSFGDDLDLFIKTHLGTTRSRDDLLLNGKIPGLNEGFSKWFDSLSLAELRLLIADRKLYDSIADRIRNGGAKHEWLMVCEMERIKAWNVSMEEVHRFTSETEKLKWTIPDDLGHEHSGARGGHTEIVGGEKQSGKGSGTLHRELRAIIQASHNVDEFNTKLLELLDRWKIDRSLLPTQLPEAKP